MKRRLEIIFDMKDNKGNISFLLDGQVLPRVFGYDIHFNARSNEFTFKSQRLATDEFGQYYVNEQGETATEELDMLKFLSDDGVVAEYIKCAKASTEFKLKNIRDTSLFNARRMIRERLG
jgi:hypothetical protein